MKYKLEVIYSYATEVLNRPLRPVARCWATTPEHVAMHSATQWAGTIELDDPHLSTREHLTAFLLYHGPYNVEPVKCSCCVLGTEKVPQWYIDANGKIFFNDKAKDQLAVQKIIEEALACMPLVSKYYVQEEIKNRIHPTRLYNRTLAAGRACEDGIENMRVGAVLVYEESIRILRGFIEYADGFIERVKA